MAEDVLFSPLRFRHLTVPNRLFRSSISGRIDNYDGTGTPARLHWEEKFAEGGVGCLISAHVPVSVRGRILPGYAFIDSDDKIPFWRAVGERVHRHDCRFILQLAHSGRQQDIGGVENLGRLPQSSTSATDPFHGLQSRAMTVGEIREVVQQFVDGARRAREAGLDGVELHGANGYLITQFLSSGINDRGDEYGGPLENRARFLLEIIRGIRREVGSDFHVQVKISAVDHNDAVIFWSKAGNTLAESVEVCRWIEEAGADAIHVSTGSLFPHPLNPPGGLPLDEAERDYSIMLPSGIHALRNYFLFRYRILRPIFHLLWDRLRTDVNEGINLPHSRSIKQAVKIPVLVTGGFQTATVMRKAILDGDCDGITMARTLIANPDLPRRFQAGEDRADRPCTYCNRCLVNVLEHPLACYEPRRFKDYDEMMAQVRSFIGPDAADPGVKPNPS